MLTNSDFLFIHYPKAAGKSLAKYMIEAWKGPIHGIVSPAQMRELEDVLRPDVTLEIGRGHENMRRARILLAERGERIEDKRGIFVCMRNPYDLAVSTYFFMRQTFEHNRTRPRFQRAMAQSFEEFWATGDLTAPPERWFTLRGKVLPNQRYIRFEHMREDLAALAGEFGFGEACLPHLNASRRGHYADYMTDRAEKAIYAHFRYLFDAGHYRRERFGSAPAIEEPPMEERFDPADAGPPTAARGERGSGAAEPR